MKKVALSLGLAAFIGSGLFAQLAPAAEPDPNAPEMKFETEVIDYGEIEQNSNGVREFKFKNTGKSPLIITQATGSCGCTVPTYPKAPIKPGEEAVISVKYATNRIGPFEKSVTIKSNSASGTKILKIKGKVNKLPEDETFPANKASEGAPME